MERNKSYGAIFDQMVSAIKSGEEALVSESMEAMMEQAAQKATAAMEQKLEEAQQTADNAVLANRGVRQLTSVERTYYQAVMDAMRSERPRQALENINLTFPVTVVNSVFDELRERHPLLNRIDFQNASGSYKILVDNSEGQSAVWGDLCDEIVKEVSAGFSVVDASLLKLSAFMLVCKPGMELGAEWLDNYVRGILYNTLANGLENGIVNGNGNKQPIGMIRQVGEGVAVVGGVYPEKEPITVTDFGMTTLGKLISMMAVNNGKTRAVRDLILLVNPFDYYDKVAAATTIMAPDGSYRTTLPYNIEVIQSSAVAMGKAVLGMANRYFAAAGISKDGRIEYDDSVKFLDDKRAYLIKAYANGMPKDNNAFLYLDITNVQPAVYKAVLVTPADPSDDATLSSLKIGNLTLSPVVGQERTYTAATTNATNIVTAVPSDAGASIAITVNDVSIQNGTAATWTEGSNTVEVTVTAADGETELTYTVTVTKS